jgi:hypothetical protein
VREDVVRRSTHICILRPYLAVVKVSMPAMRTETAAAYVSSASEIDLGLGLPTVHAGPTCILLINGSVLAHAHAPNTY